ncbi:hypothetical protein [Dyadobacter sp. 32]|uniref:hypothetical protein n=1 Tax=Dyadobacter sp. 32 TaxID=538966 RepID=UPI0011EBFBC7
MNVKFIHPNILDNYLNGECSEAERMVVEDWFESLTTVKNYLEWFPEKQQTKIQENIFALIKLEIGLREKKLDRES